MQITQRKFHINFGNFRVSIWSMLVEILILLSTYYRKFDGLWSKISAYPLKNINVSLTLFMLTQTEPPPVYHHCSKCGGGGEGASLVLVRMCLRIVHAWSHHAKMRQRFQIITNFWGNAQFYCYFKKIIHFLRDIIEISVQNESPIFFGFIEKLLFFPYLSSAW